MKGGSLGHKVIERRLEDNAEREGKEGEDGDDMIGYKHVEKDGGARPSGPFDLSDQKIKQWAEDDGKDAAGLMKSGCRRCKPRSSTKGD